MSGAACIILNREIRTTVAGTHFHEVCVRAVLDRADVADAISEAPERIRNAIQEIQMERFSWNIAQAQMIRTLLLRHIAGVDWDEERDAPRFPYAD